MNRTSLIDTIEREYKAALKAIPSPGTGCHPALLKPAIKGVKLGLSFDQIVDDIADAIPAGGRHVKRREIEDTVRTAQNEVQPIGSASSTWVKSEPKKPRYSIPPLTDEEAEAWAQKFIGINPDAQRDDIRKLSRVNEPSCTDFLNALYSPDEFLCIGDRFTNTVETVEDHIDRLKQQEHVESPHVWPNPFTGQTKRRTRADGTTYESGRLKELVASRRYCCIEFDDVERWPLPRQGAFWHGVIQSDALPVAALIYSGKKSLHAWLHIDAEDAEQWQRLVEVQLFDREGGVFEKLGSDTAGKQPAQASRMPWHVRSETGNTQELLYLHPRTVSLRQRIISKSIK